MGTRLLKGLSRLRSESRSRRRRFQLPDGKAVYVALEEIYWNCLEEVAAREGLTLDAIVESAHRSQPDMALSQKLRLVGLRYFQGSMLDPGSPAWEDGAQALGEAPDRKRLH
jgi:predicted DNA-binding ribbon-helix-helix protein